MDLSEKLYHRSEPYSFQRRRDAAHSSYPRPAQPNTSQPNQIFGVSGWGTGTREYWDTIFKSYMDKGKGASQLTNLALGR